jgi:hypothetical protein
MGLWTLLVLVLLVGYGRLGFVASAFVTVAGPVGPSRGPQDAS